MSVTNLRKLSLERALLRLLEFRHGIPALVTLIAILTLATACAVLHLADRPFDTDLASLLPDKLAPRLSEGLEAQLRERLAGSDASQIVAVVSVRPGDEKTLHKAALAWEEVALTNPAVSRLPEAASGRSAIRIPQAAGNVLAASDRKALERLAALPAAEAGGLLAARAAACLSPASPRLLGFDADPFCSFDKWLLERAGETPWREAADGDRKWLHLAGVEKGDVSLALILSADSGIIASGNAGLAETLARAAKAAQDAAPDFSVSVSAAGVPLFTDAIASRAQREISLIGTVSTVGVALFAWLLFGRLRVILLLAGTVAAGFLIALGAAFCVFHTLSLVTFVFGATLIGVSVDYPAHWVALRRPGETALERRRRLIGPLLCAALSSAAAYGALALAPLPGLRQMALLAATGLLGALLTVLAGLPWLERGLASGAGDDTRTLTFLARKLPGLPRLNAQTIRRPWALGLLAAWMALLACGLARLELASGVRDLQSAPASLIAAQQEVSRAMRLPSPAQCFVTEAKTLDEALGLETALRGVIAADPRLSGVTATSLSAWLPDARTQDENRALSRRALSLAAPALESALGAAPKGPGEERLTLDALLATPLGGEARKLVLRNDPEGAALLTLLSGVGPGELAALREATEKLDGVHFIDITQGMSEGLERHRDAILALLAGGVAALWLTLSLRFRAESWRAVTPAAAGLLTAAAVLGLLGLPLTLFAALGMVLLLGLGVDCGIFFTERPDDGRMAAAVLFSGVTTMLSFGLLALSSTPALAVFGVTLLAGDVAIWIAAPLLRPVKERANDTSRTASA